MMRATRKAGDGTAPAFPEDTFEHAVKRLCFSPPEAAVAVQSECDAQPSGTPEHPLREFPAAPAKQDPERTAPSASVPSLDDLGPDLLLHVLRRAHPTAWDLCRLACVSRTWQQLCYSRIFWTKLRVSSGSIRPGVEALAARCAHVTELHIDDPRCELFILHPIVTACAATLQRVVINCDKDATPRNEAAICSILWIISLHCKKVETVELVSDGKRSGFEYLDTKALWYLTSGFRSMRSFACLCRDSMTKQSLYLMVIAWRELACLRVHCAQLHKEDLLCLRKCHALRILELFGGDLGVLMASAVGASAGVGAASVGGPASAEGGQVQRARGGRMVESITEVIHAELEVLVVSNTATSPVHLAALLAGFPGLKRVLLNRDSWTQGTPAELQRLRRQFGTLQRWLQAERGVELLMEE